jgi:hypothetical protein
MSAAAVPSIVVQSAVAQQAKSEIIHDTEYCILATQHGEQRAAQEQEINRKLAELSPPAPEAALALPKMTK